MMPGLGSRYDIDIEVTSIPRADYQNEEYGKSGLPKAPAIVIDDETVIVGKDISEEELESAVRRHLALSQEDSR
jgi:hypothetical protein